MVRRATVVLGLVLAALAAASWVAPKSPGRRMLRSGGADPATAAADRGPAPAADFCTPSEARPQADSLYAVLEMPQRELLDRFNYLRRHRDEASDELWEGMALVSSRDGDHGRGYELIASASDAEPEGFSMPWATALWLSNRALAAKDLSTAARWADVCADADPASAAGPVLRSLIAARRRDPGAQRHALQVAFERQPDEPSIAFALARRLDRAGLSASALAPLQAYLEGVPDDEYATRMQQRVAHQASLQEHFRTVSGQGVALRYAPELAPSVAQRTHQLVVEALQRAASLLRCQRRPELTAILYRDRRQMLGAICTPSWTGARFDGALHVPGRLPTGQWRPTVEHEALHAQLAACVPRAPMWFNEGLAQHFAEPPSRLRGKHARTLVNNQTWIPFSSLEGAISEISDSPEARLAYFQSRAMVEYLVDRHGSDVLAKAVTTLNSGVATDQLLEHLAGPQLDGRTLLRWMKQKGWHRGP